MCCLDNPVADCGLSHKQNSGSMGNKAASRQTTAVRQARASAAARVQIQQRARLRHLVSQATAAPAALDERDGKHRQGPPSALTALAVSSGGASQQGAFLEKVQQVQDTQLGRGGMVFTKQDLLQLMFVLDHSLGRHTLPSLQYVFTTVAREHTVAELRQLIRSLVYDADTLLQLASSGQPLLLTRPTVST